MKDIEITTRILPLLVSATYEAYDSYTARLALAPNGAHDIHITVIHDSHTGTASYEMRGNSSPLSLAVHDADALIVLARSFGDIVASAVCQVEFRLVEQIDALLAPLSLSNVILDQHQAEPAQSAPTTGEIEAVAQPRADVDALIAEINARSEVRA